MTETTNNQVKEPAENQALKQAAAKLPAEYLIGIENDTVYQHIIKAVSERKPLIKEIEQAVTDTELIIVTADVISRALNSNLSDSKTGRKLNGYVVPAYKGYVCWYSFEYDEEYLKENPAFKVDSDNFDGKLYHIINQDNKTVYVCGLGQLQNGLIPKTTFTGINAKLFGAACIDVFSVSDLVTDIRDTSAVSYYLSAEERAAVKSYVPKSLDARAVELYLRAAAKGETTLSEGDKAGYYERLAGYCYEEIKKESEGSLFNIRKNRVLSSIVSVLQTLY